MYDLIVAGGRIVREDGILEGDIAIRGETIREVASRIDAPAARVIDAAGLWVLPGLIDPHVHLGLPTKGTVAADDVSSGTIAALHGGVTTVIDFTLQRPGQPPVDSLRERLEEFDGQAACDYALHVNITDFPPDFGATIESRMREVLRLGSTSLKVFTAYSKEGMRIPSDRLGPVLRVARSLGFLPLVHAEDDSIVAAARERLTALGEVRADSFADSRPPEAEARAIGDCIEIAGAEGAEVYFVHVSTAAGVEAIRAGRRGLSGTIHLETCPQYLVLDRSAYERPDGAQFLVAPPLRSPEDREALLSALSASDVDVVATDHCPFRREQKTRPGASVFDLPNGLPGIETRLPILHTIGVVDHRITPEELVGVTATRPARIMGLSPRKGEIAPGADADLVLFDPEARWTCTASALHMRTDFSPYEGFELRGRVRRVLLRGRTVVEDGRTLVDRSGRWLSRLPRPA
jgi:dihydropyrimidinase